MKILKRLLTGLVLTSVLAAGTTVWAAEEDGTGTDGKEKQIQGDDKYYFTKETDYSQIERKDYKDIDWSKYGNNGIRDEGTKKYLEGLGIDAENDPTYGSTLAERLSDMPQTLGAKDDWAVGTVHQGMCDIVSSWFVPSEGQSYFTLGNFRDGLEGVEMVGSGWCADHTAAEPAEGHAVVSVTCTVTSVDYSTGWVYMSLYLTPEGVTDGHTSNGSGLIGYQHIAANVKVRKAFNGKLKLMKSSANPDITDGNSCYSLEGAKYGVYSDSGCKKQVATLTTDAGGNSNEVELNAGDYWVKETVAPAGYALDRKVYPVTVSTGQTKVLKVMDLPTMDPVGVLLGKVDSETNQNKPQGSASLEGALFQLKYYKGIYNEDPAIQGVSPARSWVFRTNKDGFTYYSTEYLESGDELYMSASGTPHLPVGTITIQEKTPPDGYLLNPEVFVVKITSNNDGSEFVYTYNEPEIPENILRLDIAKTIKGTQTAIPGVVFRHTRPDKSVETVTTDARGKAAFKGLQRGKHTIEEASVPDGFTLNPGKVTFTVAPDNKITVNSNTATAENGGMTFTVQDGGCGLLQVEDALAPYSLLLHKQNEAAKKLQGAEFTIYSDKACKNVVAKGTTDADGTLQFPNLVVGTAYYLKETKAPQGYRIPMHPDGSEIIYEFYTKSDPVADMFEYYVNGTKHTGGEGPYAITGTKADRAVNLTVINQTGMKMPKTGSGWTLAFTLCGLSCMACGLLYHLKKRKIGGKEDNDKV